ncbi:MAG: acyl-CoA desaturase [Puniceicoccaceae bacterium]
MNLKLLRKPHNPLEAYFMVGYHLALLVLLPFAWDQFSWAAAGFFLVTFVIGGLSITVGYHRLFSHRAYRAKPVFETATLLGSLLAVQGSALLWSHDHRLHHKHTDTEKDPYSIKKGFWYAHMMWIFTHQRDFQESLVGDLMKNPRVLFQHRNYAILALTANLVVLGLAMLWMPFLAALVFATLLRIFAIHHCTWFINSLAHTFGSKTYARELSAVDNAVLAFLTFGEGYHNYHHAFASDYRNGVRWYHFDPTKWVIWMASKLGLVDRLQTMDSLKTQSLLVKKDRTLILDRLRHEADLAAHHLMERVTEQAESFEKAIHDLRERMKERRRLAIEVGEQAVRREIRELKSRVRSEWRAWVALTRHAQACYQMEHSH